MDQSVNLFTEAYEDKKMPLPGKTKSSEKSSYKTIVPILR